jgi:hypothetical protein
MLSYPKIEDRIIDDGRISQWLANQILETRHHDVSATIEDLKKLKVILDKRIELQMKEERKLESQGNLNVVNLNVVKF